MSAFTPRLGDRSLFPTLKARAYLNHAALSPPSLPVLEAVEGCLGDLAARGLHAAIEQRFAREPLRAKLAQLMGARSVDIGFVQNTTAGVITVARSIRFRAGERILVFEGEFPANVTPWQLVAQDEQLELSFVSLDGFSRSVDEGLLDLERELRCGARLVAVSAVQFQTGLRMPLAEMAALCHRFGAELFVDAIQALGAVPIDVGASEIDYLVAGGHKFLMGLEGAGVLYVRPRALGELSLGLSGWTAHERGFDFLIEGAGHLRYDRPLKREVSFVEQGALSTLGYAALDAAVDLLLSLGVEAIHEHLNGYLDRLEPALEELGCQSVRKPDLARRSATLSVTLPEGASLKAVAHSLNQQGVAVSTPDGYLRFAPHWPNSWDEVPFVTQVTRTALRGEAP
jgi:selenocysteine lyase/cysteine desulfurase